MKNAAAAAALGQFDRRAEVGTPTTRCRTHYTDGAWYLVGEGSDSKAYCDDCHLWLRGTAAEHDTRNIAAYQAYLNSPATIAALAQIRIDGQKIRIKFSPAGRRRLTGTTCRYGW